MMSQNAKPMNSKVLKADSLIHVRTLVVTSLPLIIRQSSNGLSGNLVRTVRHWSATPLYKLQHGT